MDREVTALSVGGAYTTDVAMLELGERHSTVGPVTQSILACSYFLS